MRSLSAIGLCLAVLLAGCTRSTGGRTPDLGPARGFDRHPLYWAGPRFEKWDLEHVDVGHAEFATFIYGTCEIRRGSDGGCPPPLAIQIQPLCAHLDAVARAPIWRRRRVRGAPVGTIDSAPVMFTRSVQIKVYRGQGSDPGLPMRALRALRSINDVEPVIDRGERFPPASLAVLSGAVECHDPATPRVAGVPGPLELGRWVCSPRGTRRACAGPVAVGVPYLYVLRTHCGIHDAYFDGRLWRARPRLSDGSGNPPPGWTNPEQLGTMRRLGPTLAVFEARHTGSLASFTPAPPGWRSVLCE